MRFVVEHGQKNNLPLADHIDVRLQEERKQFRAMEQLLNCSSHILCGINAFDKATSSSQDAVRTPTPIASAIEQYTLTNSTISPTESSSTFLTQHQKLTIIFFTLSIHIIIQRFNRLVDSRNNHSTLGSGIQVLLPITMVQVRFGSPSRYSPPLSQFHPSPHALIKQETFIWLNNADCSGTCCGGPISIRTILANY